MVFLILGLTSGRLDMISTPAMQNWIWPFFAGAGLSAAVVLGLVRAHDRRDGYTTILRALRAGVHERRTHD
jgi:hypothetical protein